MVFSDFFNPAWHRRSAVSVRSPAIERTQPLPRMTRSSNLTAFLGGAVLFRLSGPLLPGRRKFLASRRVTFRTVQQGGASTCSEPDPRDLIPLRAGLLPPHPRNSRAVVFGREISDPQGQSIPVRKVNSPCK